jgi:hypothetical protein
MKNCIQYFRKTLLLFLLGLIAAPMMKAQNINVFFYAPTDSINAHFTGATAAYIHADDNCNGPTGYSYVVLDNQTAPIFRNMTGNMIIRRTYDSLTNVNSVLRRRIMQLRNLSNGLVNNLQIRMFDDRTGLAATDNCKCDNLFGALKGVWACAGNERQAGQYFGDVMFGELAANHIINNFPGGWWAWYETVVHEFSHTQFALEYDAAGNPVQNKWGRNGVSISYGGDAGHWGSEIQGDQQSPLDEGLATFWGLERNTVGRDSLIAWLNKNDRRLYLGSHSVLTGTPLMWNAPHGVIFSGTIPANRIVTPTGWNPIRLVSPHIQTGAGYELRSYRWLDVPGQFGFYNEQMFQAYALFFYENAIPSRTESFDMMLRAARVMTAPNNRLRYPALFANALANELERFARTPAGTAAETNRTLASSMFAYALYDIVTHFGMSEADLRREFTVNMETYLPVARPLAFNNYWAHRDAVKQLVCPFLGGANCAGNSNIDFVRAVREARTYFSEPARILR